jgi:hypothetical protein
VTWAQIERYLTVYLGVINAGFATIVLVGGANRFPPPTYEPLLDMTGGEVWPYGVLFGISAIGLLGRGYWSRMVGCAFGIVAHSTFAALFLVAVLRFPDAAATAWWAYLAFASQSATCAGLMWFHRKGPRPGGRGA